MSTNVWRDDDMHGEMAGPASLGPIPHRFKASPRATQRVLAVAGEPLLREGDTFRHEGTSHHKPQAGNSFVRAADVTGKGQFTVAGQQLLLVNGVAVMTLAGSLETCSDAARETTCEAAILLSQYPPLLVNDRPVLPGQV